jgi:hypothetical protein
VLAALTKGGLAAATWPPGTPPAASWSTHGTGVIQTTVHPANSYRRPGGRLPSLGRAGPVSDVVDGVLLLESSP